MVIKVKKGLNLRIEGSVESSTEPVKIKTEKVAVSPDDYEGFQPKTEVRVGDKVRIGDVLLHDKKDPRIKLVSPMAGVVEAIERGARRHIDRIVIKTDNTDADYRKFDTSDRDSAPKLVELLAECGILAMIRCRPFAVIPSADILPRDIFVTTFDSAPLAVDRKWTEKDAEFLQAGAKILAKITRGKVYVSRRENSSMPVVQEVVDVVVKGPHPAGLCGVQAANIAPVNKGETIWTLSAETMWRIGRLFKEGVFDPSTTVTVCGSCVATPYIAETLIGADVKPLLAGHLKESDKHVRVISGNVLTGIKIENDNDYLHYPYTQLTVIPEGDDVDEFMGWASLSPSKMSVSPSYPGRFLRRLFNPDARINGGQRAMIMSGEYDRVVPMGILTEYLIKAIKSRDIDMMEKLGIYEVAPEDFALAECIDSSKQPLQKIVREGLDFQRNELQ